MVSHALGPRAEIDARLDRTALVFGLSPHERRLLAFLLDETIGATAQPGRGATRIADVVERGGGATVADVLAALDPAGALSRWALVSVGDGPWRERSVGLDDTFWPRLVGHWPRELPRARDLDADLLDRLVLDDATRARARAIARWARGVQGWPTVALHGPRGTGRATLGQAIAGALGLAALVVEGAAVRAGAPRLLAREAIWQQAALVIDGADAAEPAALHELAIALSAPLIATSTGHSFGREAPARPTSIMTVPAFDRAARAELWRRALRREDVGEQRVDAARLAGRFRFGPGHIAAAVRSAVTHEHGVSDDALIAQCRGLPAGEIGGLARRVELPYAWDDLVVSPKIRRELELVVTWGRDGAALFDAEGPGGRVRAAHGVGCLFHGPPGTGKTMAAQVIARQLDRELYRVDLSQVIDKYIGETEKRLDRVLREAEGVDCVLLFDEADALFARRTEVREARDRYANMETGFLLQRLEEHQGLCILASNIQSSIDAAFHRRLLVVAEFSLPTAIERKTIWDRHLPPGEGRAADVDLDFLASRFALSGGDIRNAVVIAVLLAGQQRASLEMRHLVIAAWREQAKAGRLVDARELGPWQDAVAAFASAGRDP